VNDAEPRAEQVPSETQVHTAGVDLIDGSAPGRLDDVGREFVRRIAAASGVHPMGMRLDERRLVRWLASTDESTVVAVERLLHAARAAERMRTADRRPLVERAEALGVGHADLLAQARVEAGRAYLDDLFDPYQTAELDDPPADAAGPVADARRRVLRLVHGWLDTLEIEAGS